MTYKNPEVINDLGGIQMQDVETDIYTYHPPGSSTYEAALAGEYGEVVPFIPPSPPTAEELLAQERAQMVCTRRQGKLALGPDIWASTLDLLNNPDPSWSPTTLWALQVAIEDTVEWRRTDPDMQMLIWAMNLTDKQADDLFRLAMTL